MPAAVVAALLLSAAPLVGQTPQSAAAASAAGGVSANWFDAVVGPAAAVFHVMVGTGEASALSSESPAVALETSAHDADLAVSQLIDHPHPSPEPPATAAPEPATLTLAATGLAGLVASVRRRRKRAG
ncbi:MAG: PEP-CTERM sorting domain-containing protein [Gemmatimonadaceae bacterium]